MPIPYFCYISRGKIDRLLEAMSDDTRDEWKEVTTSENQVSLNGSSDLSLAGVLTLFKGGAAFGRKGVIQMERKVKQHYAEKLRKVLLSLTRDAPIPSLVEALSENKLSSTYYYYEGEFVCQPFVGAENMMTLSSDAIGARINVDCSTRYFSETDESGHLFSQSANIRFLSGAIPLKLSTVLLILRRNQSEIFASPLFLQLHAPDSPFDTSIL